MPRKIAWDQECRSCGGTGLYKGFAEGAGFAVVCYVCKGSGCLHTSFTYEPFTTRKKRKDIKRVLQCNPGICVGIGTTSEEEVLTETSFGGVKYVDWVKNGNVFPPKTEMRNYTCPAWWYQVADYSRKPNWKECIGLGSFSKCSHFITKNKCWKRFDEEKL